MLRILPTAIILILLGIIVGLNLQATPEIKTPPPTASLLAITTSELKTQLSDLQTKVSQLETSLNNEIARHKKTNLQLNELKHAFTLASNNNAPDKTENDDDLIAKSKALITDVTKPRLTEAQRNKNILITIGIDDNSANRIQRLAEKKEMDQLYLRNTASREGWFGTEKFFEKTRELDLKSNIYREELGDEQYDQFLYASQLTNRITIQSVLSESPAENTGLQAGDYIISYDNQRVFNWSDLTALTTNGEDGESVPVEVKRNNQTFQYFITRGPLGIRLSSERIDPRLP